MMPVGFYCGMFVVVKSVVIKMEVCLFEPEIAQNAGTIARLCTCFGVPMNIIEPASFVIGSHDFRRAGMDYIDRTKIKCHNSFQEFRQNFEGRIILLDVKATLPYFEFDYKENDCIMAGKESTGVPDDIYELCDEKVIIPMVGGGRSLNVAISLAIGLSEALRQINYARHHLDF